MGSARRRATAVVAVLGATVVALAGLTVAAFASTDAPGASPTGDVFYEADCTLSLQTGRVAPYLIGLNLNASPDNIAATGATFGATGTIDVPIIGPVIAALTQLGLQGATFGPSVSLTVGSTNGTATGSFTYTHDYPKVALGTVGSPGRRITGVSYSTGSTQLVGGANGTFSQQDIGYSVAGPGAPTPPGGDTIDPTSVISAVDANGKNATMSLPAKFGALGAAIGLGTTTNFTDSTVNIPNTTFTTASTPGGVANIGVTAVKSVTLNAALAIAFGGVAGVAVDDAHPACVLTGWGSGGVAGPHQLHATAPVLPAPPATGAATQLVLPSGGFVSQANTAIKITPPPAAHVTITPPPTTSTSTTASTTTTSTSTTTTVPETTTTSSTIPPETTTTTTAAPTTTTSTTTIPGDTTTTSTTLEPTTTTTATTTTTTTTVPPTTTTTTTVAPTTTSTSTTSTTAPPPTTTSTSTTTVAPPTSTTTIPDTGSSTTTTTVPGPNLSSSTVTPGGSVTITDDGWQPDSTVDLTLHSTVVSLGSAQVDGDGAIKATVVIPSNTVPGAHEIQITGTDANGQPATHTVALTVESTTVSTQGGTTTGSGSGSSGTSGSLPRTGGPVLPLLILSISLIAAGIVLGTRRRRTA